LFFRKGKKWLLIYYKEGEKFKNKTSDNTAYPVQEFFSIIFYKVRKIPSPKFLFRYRYTKTSDDADTLYAIAPLSVKIKI